MPDHTRGIIVLAVEAGFKPAFGASGNPASEFNVLSVDETGLKSNQRAGYKPAPCIMKEYIV